MGKATRAERVVVSLARKAEVLRGESSVAPAAVVEEWSRSEGRELGEKIKKGDTRFECGLVSA